MIKGAHASERCALLAMSLILLGMVLGCGGTVEETTGEASADMMGEAPVCVPGCGANQSCVNGVCQPSTVVPTPSGAGVGDACTENGACATALCLADEDIPGGYCSKICATGIAGAMDRCPSASICVQLGDAASACLAGCGVDSDCRAGYICESVGPRGSVCVPACTSNRDCGFDEVCDMTGGRCVVDASSAGRIGSSCEESSECSDGLCLDELSTDWPGGTCAGDCSGLPDGSFCDGSNPSSGLCLEFEDGDGLCLPSCATSSDCRPEYICSVDLGASNDEGYGFCIPGCEYLACEADEVCDVSGICIAQMSLPQRITTRTLGSFMVTDSDFATTTFDVPSGTISFGLTFDSDNPIDGVAGVVRLSGPTGEVLYDEFNPISSVMKYFAGDGNPTALIYPNAPSLNVTPGRYTVELGAYAPANVKVELHLKEGSSPVQEKLPLTFWFMLNSYYTASSAKSDPAFQQAVTKMIAIYDSAGVDISTIAYRDVEESVAANYSVFDVESTSIEVAILEAIDGVRTSGAHIVFNDQLFTSDGGVLYGVSAGLPGPPSLNGSRALGVFVALDIHVEGDGLDTDELAATMGHELGHYLGLYHISEADGSSHDPLQDTPQCDARQDLDQSGTLSGDECGDAAATNMMFWTSSEGHNQNKLSTAQRWVLHRNPAMFE